MDLITIDAPAVEQQQAEFFTFQSISFNFGEGASAPTIDLSKFTLDISIGPDAVDISIHDPFIDFEFHVFRAYNDPIIDAASLYDPVTGWPDDWSALLS